MHTSQGKFLTFLLGREEYGLPVLKVREIIKLMDVTSVPQMPMHVSGVINLRGKVIPVVDLRMKFGLPAQGGPSRSCIIVVEVVSIGLMGVIVDAVSEVLHVTTADVDPAPDFGERVSTDYMLGLAKVKGTVKILLDLDHVLGADATVLASSSLSA